MGDIKMRIAESLLICVLATGCATPASKVWTTSERKDDFTDELSKMVTLNATPGYFGGAKYYPFVGVKNGEMVVGLRSAGAYRLPVGTVQLRIDDNAAWTITTDETPVYLAPSVPGTPGVSTNLQAGMMISMTKILSPFTATTGDKAKSILKQMLQGQSLRYRTVGLNEAGSTTGEAKLDASFSAALVRIGIDPASL